jgi:ribosomal protein S18 acetylase RimI-like enzyme
MPAPFGPSALRRAIIAEVDRQINGGRASLLEALAARAWPAGEQQRLDGWVLRRTPSVRRRRLNSALPPSAAEPHDDAVVDAVERFYRAHGAAPMVQVSPAEELGALDSELHERGWRADGPTDILVAAVDDVPAAVSADVAVSTRPVVDREWVGAWIVAEGRPDAHETYAHVLRRIPSPAGFAVAHVEGRSVGVGLAVCERGWSGVFCMAVDPAARRRGVARALLRALADWSREQGADGIYLQVECDNAPAQGLYASMAFTRSHGYHFRIAP